MSTVELTYPLNNAEISFLTEIQRAFFDDPKRFVDHELKMEPNEVDMTIPRVIDFQWTPADADGEVQIALDPSFSSYESFPGSKGSAQVFNLLHDTTYYCRVKVGETYSAVTSFKVSAELPRWIYMPQVTNVRDLGLWKTQSGKRIKQGMLFRGAQLDSWTSLPEGSPITENGIRVFLEQLHIRTELDLRGLTEGTQVMQVKNYYKFPMSAYVTWKVRGIFTDDQKEYVRKIFGILADETSYPLYFHCAGGGDRTGTIAFLLEALLGLDEESLLTEYELSNLSVSGERSRFSEVWRKFMEEMDTFVPGGTRQEQVISYLKSCGIDDEILEKIPTILLESAD